MATVAGVDQLYLQNHRVRTWTPLTTTNSDGDPISYASNGTGAVAIQVNGTFGTGGTLVIQGSNNGVNWYSLNDPANTAVSFTTAGLKTVVDMPLYIRPLVSAGDGTTSLTVIAAMQKTTASVM